jgi:hypothetical protein
MRFNTTPPAMLASFREHKLEYHTLRVNALSRANEWQMRDRNKNSEQHGDDRDCYQQRAQAKPKFRFAPLPGRAPSASAMNNRDRPVASKVGDQLCNQAGAERIQNKSLDVKMSWYRTALLPENQGPSETPTSVEIIPIPRSV